MSAHKTILIVDDSRVSRLMARTYIVNKYPDWTVLEASTGEEALEKAQASTPFLILMDVNMPGMGGLAATEQLRALLPDTHITLVTANVQDGTRKRAQELGAGFVEKPITEARIHQLLSDLE
ncbi:MAG TPA: response regulator [Burkholderiaceae bacterium]